MKLPAEQQFHKSQNEVLHRLDGPAVEWPDGSKEWWIEGKEITEKGFRSHIAERDYKASFPPGTIIADFAAFD